MRFVSRNVSQGITTQKEMEEKVITKAELKDAEEIWFINSVRKWLKVELFE